MFQRGLRAVFLAIILTSTAGGLAQFGLERELFDEDISVRSVVEQIDLAERTQGRATQEGVMDVFLMTPNLSSDLANALYRAARRGLAVGLLVDLRDNQNSYIGDLKAAGVQVRTSETRGWGVVINLRDAYVKTTPPWRSDETILRIDLETQPPTFLQGMSFAWSRAAPL